MSRKINVISVNKGNLNALKKATAQKRMKVARERSQTILDQIRQDLQVSPDKLKHFFNV